MLAGNESDHQMSMRYLRDRAAGNAAASPLGYGAGGRTMTLPGGANPRARYASEFRTSRGAFGDFLWDVTHWWIGLP